MTAQDGDNADGITGYTLTGGTDLNLFEIDSAGMLTFKNAPDFERPADAGGNNENIVEVTATGGAGTREMTGTQTTCRSLFWRCPTMSMPRRFSPVNPPSRLTKTEP